MNQISTSYKKALHLKKTILIPLSISCLLFVKCTKTDSLPQNIPVEKTVKIEEKKNDLKTRLEKEIKSLEKDSDLTKNVNSVDGIVIVLALYKVYASIIKEGKESPYVEEQKLAKSLEKKVMNSQIKAFPKLRLIYYKLMKEKLWENNIEVKIIGSTNKTLQFTAGYFASNKNIQETQSTLHEMLLNLRFKQTQYKWYSGDDEYTYYNIESLKDSEIIDETL
ncbi:MULTISPECIES: hypothetical protein [Chryseobacterium]|uniref:Lipoprotein n=1 Tax=Chryseobacterium geocarposphaerae TaxID=1416776 RepID=A0ABU1LEY7_9FLAO|nr:MULTISPECIES: hypothetical protein [Chryseobacterium]MDR6405120.1 hypothetical protein [Chryseobacterium geocarposphaerae]MDR6697903.1 hypothetical protein [Chryseobacterium ginsenosidimutans]